MLREGPTDASMTARACLTRAFRRCRPGRVSTSPLPRTRSALITMSILSRYILRHHLAPGVGGLAIFYFVLSMDFLVDYLELFLAKGVPLTAVAEAFALSLAWMTVLAVPMAVMVAVITAFGGLSGANEIVAVKASGISVFALILPVLVAAALVTVGLFAFGDRVLPDANYRLKTLLVDIHRVRPLASIEPGVLTELPGGYQIVVDAMDPRTSRITGIRIHRSQAGRATQMIVAQRGEIVSVESGDGVQIRLFDGEIHETDPQDPTKYSRLLFDRHAINISDVGSELVRTDRAKRGDRELSVAELRDRYGAHMSEAADARERLAGFLAERIEATLDMAEGEAPLKSPAELESERAATLRRAEAELRTVVAGARKARTVAVEYHKKIAIPFSCVIFVLLGAPLGIRSRRGGIGIGAGIGILFFLVYYLFLIGGEQLGDRGFISPFWAMWSANVLFAAVGALLTASTCLEWSLAPPWARPGRRGGTGGTREPGVEA